MFRCSYNDTNRNFFLRRPHHGKNGAHSKRILLNQDYRKICSIDTEVIDTPTTPLIHQMSRFWLINEGQGVLKLQDREYKLCPGTIVSILPWQISDVIQVDAPLQYYLLAYYCDNINSIIKPVYSADSKPVSLIER